MSLMLMERLALVGVALVSTLPLTRVDSFLRHEQEEHYSFLSDRTQCAIFKMHNLPANTIVHRALPRE